MTIWDRVERAAGGARPTLTYERIALAGVALADAEGLGAVSMRKVAARLGSGTMSLYRYVESRDDLIALMVDAIMAEAVVPSPTGDWRADLTGYARISRRVTLRHPWLADYATSMSGFGPNGLAMAESTLALLDGYGLTGAQMFDLWATVQAFVQGYVLEEVARRAMQQRSGSERLSWRFDPPPQLHRALATGRYPLLSRLVADAALPPDADATFERHLGYVLDGVAGIIEGRDRG